MRLLTSLPRTCSTVRCLWLNRLPSTSQRFYYPASLLKDQTREVRTRSGHERNDHSEKESTGQNEEKKEGTSEQQENSKESGEKPKMTPELARKLRMYVLAVGGLSFVTSFLLLSNMFKEGTGIPTGVKPEHFTKPGIDFATFVDKYLKTGEVSHIVFCPQFSRAIAFLPRGAIIDGKPVSEDAVIINYQQNAQQFWADVRKEEALIGISLSNGIKIEMYQGLTTWKVLEFLIGVLIIAWLGTQYGRLLRKRILEKKAQSGQK